MVDESSGMVYLQPYCTGAQLDQFPWTQHGIDALDGLRALFVKCRMWQGPVSRVSDLSTHLQLPAPKTLADRNFEVLRNWGGVSALFATDTNCPSDFHLYLHDEAVVLVLEVYCNLCAHNCGMFEAGPLV